LRDDDSTAVEPEQPAGGGRANLRRYGLSLLVVVGIAAGLFFLDEGRTASAGYTSVTVAESSGPPPRIGEPAPDFAVSDLDGSTYRLSDLKGKPVWLNFWASWCPPCRAETPDVEAVYEEKKSEGLVLLAVSLGEEARPVRSYVDAAGITFRVGLDTNTQIASRYRINGLPTHFFIDRDGIIRDMQVGGLNRATMYKKLQKIMP
jgi:cytochrome c biogenesis protein CcmG, thiol:disulfide interchange protein DsbE